MLGQIINDRYRILKTLGSGGMATVYLARDLVLGRDVAAKVLHRQFTDDVDLCRRFLEEARMAALLESANIIKIYDFGQTQQRLSFIIYEYISGYNFHALQEQHIKQYGIPHEPIVSMMVCSEVLKALIVSHKSLFIHRDIKPDNVMISQSGAVKLMDFGIAKNLSLSRTQRGDFLGSPSYASPEQVQGLDIDNRTDLYSLGIMLYEAISGKLPFRGKTSVEIMMAIAKGSHSPLWVVCPHIDKKLTQFIEKSIATDKTQRFLDAQSMQEPLLKLIENHGITDPAVGLHSYFTHKLTFLKSVKTQKGKAIIPFPVIKKRTLIRKIKSQRRRITLRILNSNRSKQKNTKKINKVKIYLKNKNQSSIYYFSFSLLLIFFLFLFINKYTNYNLKKNIKDRYQSVINKIKTPSVATLSLRGSPPGTRIFIDGTPTATLKGLGHLHEFTLSPGTKLIQAIYQPINGQKYTTFQTGISLKPGSQVFLGNIQLLPLSLVRLTSNSNASITINGAVSYQVKASKPIELHLQSGHYRLEAHANTRPSHKIFKRVEAKGQHVKVEFNFP